MHEDLELEVTNESELSPEEEPIDPEQSEKLPTFFEDLKGFAASAGTAFLIVGIFLGTVFVSNMPCRGDSHSAQVEWKERQQEVAKILEAQAHGTEKNE